MTRLEYFELLCDKVGITTKELSYEVGFHPYASVEQPSIFYHSLQRASEVLDHNEIDMYYDIQRLPKDMIPFLTERETIEILVWLARLSKSEREPIFELLQEIRSRAILAKHLLPVPPSQDD